MADLVWVDVAEFGTETPNALLVKLEDDRTVFLPWSQIEKVERRPLGGGRVLVAGWLARKEDLNS